MVFDEWQNEILVAYIVSTQNKSTDFQSWMTTLKDVLRQDLLEWNLSAFIVDNVDVKINTIR
jgi:hypothetical protein